MRALLFGPLLDGLFRPTANRAWLPSCIAL